MTEPETVAGKALDNALAFDWDPEAYLPGDYLRRYRVMIVRTEREAASRLRSKLMEAAQLIHGEWCEGESFATCQSYCASFREAAGEKPE